MKRPKPPKALDAITDVADEAVVIKNQHERWRVTFALNKPTAIEMWDPGAGWVPWDGDLSTSDQRKRQERIVARAETMRLGR